MSRFVNNWRFIQNKGVCLTLVLGLSFFIFGCRSFSSKPQSTLQPVPVSSDSVQPVSTQPVSTQPISSKSVLEKPVPVQSLPFPVTSYRPPTFLELENQSKPFPEKTAAEKTMVFRSMSSENLIVKKEVLPSQMKPISVVSEQPVPEPPATETIANVDANISVNTVNSVNADVLNRRIAELEKALAESEKKSGQEKQPTTVSKPTAQIVPPIQSPHWVPTINHSGVTVSSEAERIRIEIIDQVLFQPGTWRLNPDAEELLRKIAGEIRANDPEALLEIEGHTDGVMNTDPANSTQKHDISSTKTMIIMEYFVSSLRWNATKIKTGNYGSSRPVADNNTSEGRTRNNRIEIVVLPK